MSHTKFRTILRTVAAGALALSLVACGGSGDAAKGGTDGTAAPQGNAAQQDPENLTIAMAADAISLNPGMAGGGNGQAFYYDLAYDHFLHQLPDGSYVGGLAEKWGWAEPGNKVFDVTLREGVKFSDGSDLTAEAAKASFEYLKNAGAMPAGDVERFESIEVTGPLSLRFTLKDANPQLELYFSNSKPVAAIISPEGLKNPDKLGTETFGTGPYKLDPSKTVAGQTYVYVPNEYYHTPKDQHWKTVTIQVMPDPTTALNAMLAGQVDFMFGRAADAQTAADAGMNITHVPATIAMVILSDRNGVASPAMGDVRVRQALNYAIDREAITEALFGEYGTPANQLLVEGSEGFSAKLADAYPYDPEKAKELLAEAGYADGFTIKMNVFEIEPGQVDFTQAVAAYWEAIGVHSDISVAVNLNDHMAAVASQENSALPFFYGANPMFSAATDLLQVGGAGAFFNAFGASVPKIDELLSEGASASPEERQALYAELSEYLSGEAWFAPVSTVDLIVFSRPGLEGIQVGVAGPYIDPLWFKPAAN